MDKRKWQDRPKKQAGNNDNPEKQLSQAQPSLQKLDNRAHTNTRRHDNNSWQNRRHEQRRHGEHQGGQRQLQPEGGNATLELFHNPYHFIPTPKPNGGRKGDSNKTDFTEGKAPHLSHERYLTDSKHHSGRIVCRLETVSPIFIGGRHPERNPNSVLSIPHFELKDGIPAIPATSIRGVVASLAEAASNSALRVLHDETYTRRSGMREALKALGMITTDKKDGSLKLLPLSLPAVPCDAEGNVSLRTSQDRDIYEPFFKVFTCAYAPLKVYIDGYQRKYKSKPPERERVPMSFLNGEPLPKSYSADNNSEFWYLKLAPSSLSGTEITCASKRVKQVGNSYYLNNQIPIDQAPISEAHYLGLSESERALYTKGIIRVLGIEGRESELPDGKKHEIFVQYDPDFPPGRLLDITEALKTFHELARLRTEINPVTPFELRGQRRTSSNEIQLRDGDLVFFDLSKTGKSVAQLAISSIWRRAIAGTCHEFFAGISKELLPMNKNRETISIAEQMFGFVSEQEKGSGDESLAFKSRVRFSNGISYHEPEQGYYLEEKTLKILASPKPPSQSLYFKRDNGTYIPKEGNDVLSKSKDDLPQGRKMYLHHKDAATSKPWETAPGLVNTHVDQKSKVKPVRAGVSFYFHVDFINLTDEELWLLCYSIVPTPRFMHKIGMGKPIGLGSVRLTPKGLYLIDRKERYSVEGYKKGRYHKVWKLEDPERSREIVEKYKAEFDSKGNNIESVYELAKKYQPDANIKNAIELLGEFPKHEVHYPRVGGGDVEDKLFQWFVANDKGSGKGPNKINAQRKSLEPITQSSTELPSLERYPWND